MISGGEICDLVNMACAFEFFSSGSQRLKASVFKKMIFLSDLWQKLKTWERGFHLAVGAGLPPSDCHVFDLLFSVFRNPFVLT